MEREEGWYWVNADGEWEASFWDKHEWSVLGSQLAWEDHNFDKIGPKIEPPHD